MKFIKKFKKKLWEMIVAFTKNKTYYSKIYKSYWHFKFSKTPSETRVVNYYTSVPNQGAGIGHQMANWIAGHWFAKQFGLKFVHIPFSNQNWENFLGFGEDEISIREIFQKGYKKVRLPLFVESKILDVKLQKNIIKSYQNQKVIFVAEYDQFYRDQYGVIDDIKEKFYSAKAREDNKLRFSADYFNIAIHVRRGDIVIGQETQNSNLLMRWLSNDYFEKVLEQVIANVKTAKPIAIYLFSQGGKIDFLEFDQFSNMHYCLDWTAQDSFLHMVYADLLITSKSSFSYKPALLSNGIKVCPENFWHGYPKTSDWIMVNNEGDLETGLLAFNE